MRFAVVFLALAASPAFAQQGAPLDKVYACASIGDNTARLACFDSAVGSLKQPKAPDGPAVVQHTETEKVKKEAFGLAPAVPKPSEQLAKVTVVIKSAERKGDGNYRFVTEDGQVWQQTDGVSLGLLGKGPWTAEIRRASLGSFLMRVENRIGVKVKRLE